MFSLSSSADGMVLQTIGQGPRAKAAPKPPSSVAGTTTDEAADQVLTPITDSTADDPVRKRAREIAVRLSLRPPVRGATRRRGSGDLLSVPYRGGSDDVDLDATLAVLAEHPVPEDEDIIVRERVRTRRSVVLVVDVSGSMRGERIQTAAATVGALAGELIHDDVAVIAFWSDSAVLVPMGTPFTSVGLLNALLSLPTQGLTNIGFPLELAAVQLGRRPAVEARVLLLSDCVHNAGPDPRSAAARLPRLDVLLDASGEKDLELGHDLATIGHGRMHVVHTHRDVARALTRIFTT